MTTTELTHRVFRFKRFSRKGFSAFASLHLEVTIGRLSAYITDLQLHKSGRSFLLVSRDLLSRQNLEEREELEEDPPTTLTSILALNPILCDAAERGAADCIYDFYKPSRTRSAVAFFLFSNFQTKTSS